MDQIMQARNEDSWVYTFAAERYRDQWPMADLAIPVVNSDVLLVAVLGEVQPSN